MPGLAFLFGTAVVLVGVLVAVVVSGFKPWTIVEGADGRPSTSKFQWTLRTAVILFSYSAIYFARAAMGSWEALPNIPANILIVLGFSTTTMVVAKRNHHAIRCQRSRCEALRRSRWPPLR